MSRYDLYTTLIGIISVLFVLTIYNADFYFVVKILLTAFGVGVFLHSAWILYNSKSGRRVSKTEVKKIVSKIYLIDRTGEEIFSWELYGKISMIIGKDIGENFVDIDLSRSPYAAMVDIEHAILNYSNGSWYIEDLDSRNGVAIKKAGQKKSYKLSATEPCKLDFGDIIFIGNCQLRIAD
ncbi:MAG: FHA domain-containing protein [Selenomonadaceae bacterium]|nr:FHA domain-containing protein [Selenomonadaceae bacterium]